MGLELEKQITESLSKEIQEDIDFGVLCAVMQELGHIVIELDNYTLAKIKADIVPWAKENCKSAYRHQQRKWLFSCPEDATWFKLKWS